MLRKLFKRTNESTVGFCDRCASVWTADDCAAAVVTQSRDRALAFGARFV